MKELREAEPRPLDPGSGGAGSVTTTDLSTVSNLLVPFVPFIYAFFFGKNQANRVEL